MASSCSMVATTVMFESLLSIAPFLALDGADQLAGVIFGAADIDDGDVGHRSGILHRATEASLEPAVAASRAHRDPFGQNVRGRRDRNHDHVGIGGASRADRGARYVGNDGAPGA